MYKSQMLLQRIACFLMIGACALVFIYSLGLTTDLYGNNFHYYAENLNRVKVEGSQIFYNIQGFNRQLTGAGLVLLLMSVALLVLQNHTRRKYYVANYAVVGVNLISSIAVSIWALINIASYKQDFLQVDFEKLAEMAQLYQHEWTDSTFWFDASFVVFPVLIVAALFLLFTTLLKVKVMKAEAEALSLGKEA